MSSSCKKIGLANLKALSFISLVEGKPNIRINVFTTRQDTVFGVTYLVLGPGAPISCELTEPGQKAAVQAYVESAGHKSELERMTAEKTKTGVPLR